jgi:NAD(P)-dependent dehydrogenase (short-subunit alcohol dehydrogenase family)
MWGGGSGLGADVDAACRVHGCNAGQRLIAKFPLDRHAQPEGIAGMFTFLASDDARNLTGHVYTCDGGEPAGGPAGKSCHMQEELRKKSR